MIFTAGVDVGSTYTKVVILAANGSVVGRGLAKTGFRLAEAAHTVYRAALTDAGLREADIAYVIATGYGRFQVSFRDLQATDLTAAARGARFLFRNTRTVLDVGGQTMKASRVDEVGKVKMFRLNDKCAAGTGAFLEKTARYMGYDTEEIGALATTSKTAVPISGVCAVFAESEVINHLSEGASPADIMQGAIVSLVDRSVQLMRRVQMEPEFTLIGGIVRFPSMTRLIKERLGAHVNLPHEDTVQYVNALGAAVLAGRRLTQIATDPQAAGGTRSAAAKS